MLRQSIERWKMTRSIGRRSLPTIRMEGIDGDSVVHNLHLRYEQLVPTRFYAETKIETYMSSTNLIFIFHTVAIEMSL